MGTTDRFTRIIVLRNPVSTNASKTPQRIKELQRACPHAVLTVIDTTAGGRTENTTVLAKHVAELGPHTLLCIAAGDGTVNLVAEALLTDVRFAGVAQQTPLLPLWCGNANDLACMLNGLFHRTSLTHVLQEGVVVPVWPLESQLERAASMRRHIAICYTSFGASAFTAHWLGDTTRHAGMLHMIPGARFIKELVFVQQGLAKAQEFTIEEDGKQVVVYERVFLNGSRFAKVAGVPLRLNEKRFCMATVERKTFISLVLRAMQLTNRRYLEQFIRKQVAFLAQTPTWAQFDGEPLQVSAHTRITVGLADKPIYVLSTKLRK